MSETHYKPFFLAAKSNSATVNDTVTTMTELISSNGFTVVGTYIMIPDQASVVCFTSEDLKLTAAKSSHGAFGAVLRLAVTKVGDEVQVSYTNPTYMAMAMRMEGNNESLTEKLNAILGNVEEFGTKKGITEKKLRKYHYAVGMEYFNEPDTILKFAAGEHEKAVAAVEASLAGPNAAGAGVTQIFRVDIPGKNEVVFGCGCQAQDPKHKFGNDQHIASIIDVQPLRSTAHFPYEVVVSENKVLMLHARFRIAVNFIDLEMAGDNSFMKIMDTPKALKKCLTSAVGGKN